jgi:signal transduction histidine kinase
MEKYHKAELEETVASRTAELKEAMVELNFAKSALLQAATDKSNFMANVSHEMRTPMNGIVGALDLLSEEGVSGVQAEYLAMARQSAEEMMKMVNQLLSFNNGANQNRSASRFNLIDFNSLLNSIVANKLDAFTRKSLSLSVQISDDIPGRIWVDRDSLSRLIEILLDNSLKFTEEGGVNVIVTRQASGNEDDMLLCSVTDSGTGIPEGMLERIFEPFVQGDGSFTRRHGGAGLGLSIARQNIQLLDGKLWAEHVSGGGSSFKFKFKIITP